MFPNVMSSSSKRRQRDAHQLPPGRHGLPRSFVVSNQRERILDAVAEVVSMAGYAAMSVEDIVVTAGVSRRTFYDHFKGGKEEAFLAAYDAISEQLVGRVATALEEAETFPAGVAACLQAFLEFVASEPSFADMCIVEVLAAGPQAIQRRNNVMNAFSGFIRNAAEDVLPPERRPPAITSETIVGGIYEVVYARILDGKVRELPELLPDLAYGMMLPYLGPQSAQRHTDPLRTARAASSVAAPDPA